MDEAKLVAGRYSIGTKSIQGVPGQPDETRAKLETIGDTIVGIVAEGSGSSGTSANVAQMVVDAVFSDLRKSVGSQTGIPERIADAFKAANHVIEEKAGGAKLRSFGLAVIWKDRLYVGNMGGGRAYLVSETDRMVPLTQEHPFDVRAEAEPNTKPAFWMGTAEMPLKAGDTVLLCSDGLVKKSRSGRDYVREQEFIESVQTEIAPDAARKIVRYAQGRQVDEAVAVIVIQSLKPERIALIQSTQAAVERKALIRRGAFFSGMAVLALAWIIAMSAILGSQKANGENSDLSEGVKVVNASQGMPTPTRQATPGKIGVGSVDIPLFGTVSGPSGNVDSIIYSGATLSSQDAGKRVVVGVPKDSLSIVYLLPNSQAQINFQDMVKVNLLLGGVYVQPGKGSIQVNLPQFQDALARVQGSRMVVRILSDIEIQVQCFEGVCEFLYPGQKDAIRISVGLKRIFNMQTGQAGPEVPMNAEEIAEINATCNNCINEILPTGVPLPPPGVTPLAPTPQITPLILSNGPLLPTLVHTATSTPEPFAQPTPVLIASSTPMLPSATPSPIPSLTPPFPIATLPFTDTPFPSLVPSLTPTLLPSATLFPPTATLPAITNTPKTPPGQVKHPTATPIPTQIPSLTPIPLPTDIPTAVPTPVPTAIPTAVPTDIPTAVPTPLPTDVPTAVPTLVPTPIPTLAPTLVPTAIPADIPTLTPTPVPTLAPTLVPTVAPTPDPTLLPTLAATP